MRIAVSIPIALGLILSACSLAGDVTPPPGAAPAAGASIPTPTSGPTPLPTDTGLGYPVSMPQASQAAELYQEQCAACHGATGQADGPMTPQLPVPLRDLSSPEVARSAVPAEWFRLITEGRMENLMPPFSGELAEAERWNLVAYLLALGTPPDSIGVGREVYEANCAACHGDGGRGDGPQAASLTQAPPDFAEPEFLASRSLADLMPALTERGAEHMPGAAELTEDQRWAALDYLRTFAFEYVAPPTAQAEQVISVTGSVVNGTSGAATPVGLEVTLHGFDQMSETVTLTAVTDDSGAFRFDSVPAPAGRQFVLSTTYGDVVYGSDIFSADSGQTAFDISVFVYETTADSAAIRVDRMHIFFDFAEGEVTVGELYIFSNAGDRTLADSQGTVDFSLPDGATDLNVQGAVEGTDYVVTDGGFADARPVRPGSGTSQVLFSYQLPYDGSLDLDRQVLYPVAVANVLLPDLGVELEGERLQSLGTQSIQGSAYQSFQATDIAAGDSLSLRLSGEAGASAPTGASPAASNPIGIGIGVAALGLALIGVGAWWWRRSQAPESIAAEADVEALLQDLADLDDAFEAGDIPEAEYQRRRAKLKRAVAERWEDQA